MITKNFTPTGKEHFVKTKHGKTTIQRGVCDFVTQDVDCVKITGTSPQGKNLEVFFSLEGAKLVAESLLLCLSETSQSELE